MADLAARAGIAVKTLQRIEADDRDQLLFLVEELLGLPPSSPTKGAGDSPAKVDEDEVLRRVPHGKFWLEAARRAQQLAETADPSRPRVGQIGEVPPGQSTTSEDEEDEPGTPGGGRH